LNAKIRVSSYLILIDKCTFKHIVYVTYTILHTLCLRTHVRTHTRTQCVLACVRARARARVCVCVCVGRWVCECARV